MLRTYLILALLLLAPLKAGAQEIDIQGTIRAQIEAFQSGDVGRAFEYASPNIQRLFRTPEIFGQMVEQGYPMVWRPTGLRFGSITSETGRHHQIVILKDASGASHALEYEMVRMPDGWKINGVRFVEMPDVGV